VFCLVSLAGAAGSATGFSLRSRRPGRIFSRTRGKPLENILPGRRQPVALPSYYACMPSGARTRHQPATETTSRRSHAMTATTTTITNNDQPRPCGPDCAYLDDACRCYHGETDTTPLPAGLADITLPF
jgi:hypothetical protein